MNASISIPQMDELNNIRHGVEAVVWLCYLAIQDGDNADAGNKTARCVYGMLEPWHSRLGDVLEELEGELAELRREKRERKEQGEGRKTE